MKKKELKALAKKIAEAEVVIQTSDNARDIKAAKEEIMQLSCHANNIDDMIALDNLVRDLLSKKLDF